MALAADEFVFWSGASMCWARSGPSYGYSIGLEYVEYVGGFSSSYSLCLLVVGHIVRQGDTVASRPLARKGV